MKGLLTALVLCLGASLAKADAADRAATLLEQAKVSLSAARGPKERLAALGRAAQAQEATLQALRDDLRTIFGNQRALDEEMEAEARKLRAVLAALLRLQRAPRAAALAHPGGVVSAARAGTTLATFAPMLEAEAARLRASLDEMVALRARRDEAASGARKSLAGLQSARAEIAELIRKDRRASELSPGILSRLREEGVLLAQSAADLRALSAALPAISRANGDLQAPQTASIKAAKGAILPPVEGVIERRFGSVRNGVALEGLEVTAPAYAEIYAPWAGIVRFAGDYGGYGGVVIVEPEAGMLIVLAGFARFYREAGEVVLGGEPLGSLGGPAPQTEEFLMAGVSPLEALARETLYIEVRQGDMPEDPAHWFAFEE
ncbi:MAG: peptidoglycan DD-metalloendopeptidase family protein [Pseudomonadota bacterium]